MSGNIDIIIQPAVVEVVESDDVIVVEVGAGSVDVEIVGVGPQGPQGQWQEYFETVNKNLKSYPATLGYVGGLLTTITYTTPSGSIVKTLGRTNGKLTTITLSGSLPGGISVTKTLTYTGDTLTGFTYS